MQTATTEPRLAPANGAASAYGTVIRNTETPRDIEYRVFEKVTSALELAETAPHAFAQRIQAAHDNRTLWQALASDLTSDENVLPAELRARLISLAIWVTGETDKAVHHGASLRNLIDINHTIMVGLRPRGAVVPDALDAH